MKNDKTQEIKLFAWMHDFTEQDASEIVLIFEKLAADKKYPFQSGICPNSAAEYDKAWDWYFYRYPTWESLVDSEKDQGPYGLSETECFSELNKSIFKLKSGLYIQYV